MHGMLAASLLYSVVALHEKSPKQMSPSVSDPSCEVKQCCHFFNIQFSSSESQNSNAAQVSPLNDVYMYLFYLLSWYRLRDGR